MEIEIGKKELIYYKKVNDIALMNELWNAIPELMPQITDGVITIVNLRLFTMDKKVVLWVPENIPNEVIQQVIDAHQYISPEQLIEDNEIVDGGVVDDISSN